ncbi:MAG TPA: 16S rRNA (uracil(1498)-N(3))-methyltransferase [Zoogloea sp.]|uniref:16S rRNA (uracil(1498)-N(3))-methyltransferase n=1 Tax=Zoogloea sp. TaxID=49181 RepID=UPI002C7EACE6|nr:16S rRNA (uracil(1498)-N(3))-methyltransferase [Zoogloea sp.]HMV17501.1 16S rRNA (uracil(1498)-N(3))-methyltransferase [Rhodocyclaceae bacterium]HMV62227.1 16S rRNA (uracil(1498)-N(3))-methyltransferase [Rhodocyclaceae bacterium]HMW50773.1 16S rRNA (uracil(1498)-N(3))-methyltransferase [Rhodocyclaceae bacterium]HMY48277.1 16S rRNA (uracil(1498)-N(3))-methyltransferase [Rhodocyclaceae bacterium]HMZ74965.1 16S rRNA (uracil(1498)-N(3))-methyltransferase [Rhodocyclaceae bacterium]
MNPRFFCPDGLQPDSEMILPAAVAHHAERVLRLAVGEGVTLFDGRGGECDAVLVALGRQPLARLGPRRAVERESPLAITLVQALAAGDKMDWVVQKAVELGVAAIQPVAAERSVLKLAGERAAKRVAHWQQIVVSACEQSGRNRVPEVAEILPLARWLGTPFAGRRLILAPGDAGALVRMAPPDGPLAVLVGPEGGWSPAELGLAMRAGCEPLALGPRVFRSETAGLAALAALQTLWGDFPGG